MPSLSKMENPAKFRLLHLPRVALDEVISMMVPFELLDFSKISQKTEWIVKTLPAWKRTYTVYLKIASSSSVTIYGSERNWELASTRDFSRNGVIDSYSRDYQLRHIKEMYECIKRILNFSYKQVYYALSHLSSDNRPMIDWLKRQHESFEELDIFSQTSYDNDLEYLLRNMKATECLSLTVKNELQFEWDELLPKNLISLYVEALKGVSLQQLLRMNYSRIILRDSKLTSQEINLFLKSWMASESNLNLEFFKFYKGNFEFSDTIVDLPHQKVRYENEKVFGDEKFGLYTVGSGVEIKQSSGKTGVLTIGGGGTFLCLFTF